ncbi:Peptidylprolyl isomerase [Abeliophyllum distichum]|uniref:Peptidylprolyl isomerase n=1 Tax=Abeliophyllum distichum TaxID=126358 RepID=A0ABD1NSM0_9LAMI
MLSNPSTAIVVYRDMPRILILDSKHRSGEHEPVDVVMSNQPEQSAENCPKGMLLHWQSVMPRGHFFEDLHDQSRWLTGEVTKGYQDFDQEIEPIERERSQVSEGARTNVLGEASQAHESPKLKHDRPGLLSMGIANQDGCGSLFSVTLKADHRLDRKCVVFGTLVDGHDMLKRIENAGNEEGKPTVTVKIVNSGEVKDDKKKGNKLKLGKDTVEANNHEERPKGKHRKSSKKGRKRRRYFKSESDSSSDTDSSESYSAFDSDASSLRDTSSSSDDRHTKRKRSKKDGHRYIKRKDKRCKRNDKKAKHRSKKSSPRSLSRSATASPPRRRVTGSPPHASSRRSSLKSASRSPVRPSRRSLSRNSGKPSRRSPSRSPIRLPRISASRSSGRATPRRIPSPSPARGSKQEQSPKLHKESSKIWMWCENTCT